MVLKFHYIKNKNNIFQSCEVNEKYKFISFYLHNPIDCKNFLKFAKKALEENLKKDISGEAVAAEIDIEGDKIIMYDIDTYFAGNDPNKILEIRKEDLIYILDRWIKFLEKPITDENYEEIFEMEDPVVKVLKDDKYVII
ncbi:DUF5376 family protein [Fusobacterium canifelinum]|uniref:DUF5376 family protein n=1 Tax=Fusobacterium canifelinum TaxID=285729 RepID=A0ABX7CES7_9FUSO|nr:DUF5376 family protein [Fusobacterium canifelinum]QQS87909.1 DUF5376 family protein [Fusobacterium canifelinum]